MTSRPPGISGEGLEQVARACRERGVSVAYLFGSQASGRTWPESDVDVAVLFGPTVEPREYFDRQLALMVALFGIFRTDRVDVVVLNTAPPVLKYRGVVRGGRVLYEADRRQRLAFEVRAFHEFADTAPLREVQYRSLKRTIARWREEHEGWPRGGPVVDRDVVRSLCLHLREYLRVLERSRERSMLEIASDPIVYWGVLHGLQMSCQCALDIASHILAGDERAAAQDYREAISRLSDIGVLPREFTDRFVGVAAFRNLLVHEYGQVEPLRVEQGFSQGLDEFQRFIGYVDAYLDRA
jgi:uncharacterized protein YutE (UPF0331/DUF86 family)/predicted nucleotidyltransferase